MSKLSDYLRDAPSVREPAYRPVMQGKPEDLQFLTERIGAPQNYNAQMLRLMLLNQPDNMELRKALVSNIVSAEFAGIDAFGRKVCEWQDWPVPFELIQAMARQTWDEVRHAQLGVGLLESYGGQVGEYPDTLAGMGAVQNAPAMRQQQLQMYGADPNEPAISLSVTNVQLEGAALALFEGTSELGGKIGDQLMEHCYDYNWADEVTHTAIGDWFIKRLAESDPGVEERALRAHAIAERMRAQLTGEQLEEIREFFAEEDERVKTAVGH